MNFYKQLIYKILYFFLKTVGLIPFGVSQKIAKFIAILFFYVDKKHQRVVMESLAYGYPQDISIYQLRKNAMDVFYNTVLIFFEISWSLWQNSDSFKKHCTFEGFINYVNAKNQGKGVLLLTAHVGNWELLSIAISSLGFKTNFLYRPLDFAPLENLMVNIRSRFGSKPIPSSKSMRKILKALKNRESVGILLDQNVDWYEGVFVDFFGKRACTVTGLALIALKTKAPVVPVFLIRTKNGYKVQFLNEISLVETNDKVKNIEINTQNYTKAIENQIRCNLNQWFWMHRRWKTKPYCNL